MKKEIVCAKCDNPKTFAKCLGCEAVLCESCSIFELIGSGCGCVWPAYYCIDCVYNPSINPNAAFKENSPS